MPELSRRTRTAARVVRADRDIGEGDGIANDSTERQHGLLPALAEAPVEGGDEGPRTALAAAK